MASRFPNVLSAGRRHHSHTVSPSDNALAAHPEGV